MIVLLDIYINVRNLLILFTIGGAQGRINVQYKLQFNVHTFIWCFATK